MVMSFEEIELLSPEGQIDRYSQLAAHYEELARQAHTDGAKMFFQDISRDMAKRANAATVWA
jgi:hypothetical protein